MLKSILMPDRGDGMVATVLAHAAALALQHDAQVNVVHCTQVALLAKRFDKAHAVWVGRHESRHALAHLVAADVVDYKTDTVDGGDADALDRLVTFYQPQLAAYRHAVAAMFRLPTEKIAARLLLVSPGVYSWRTLPAWLRRATGMML